MVAHWVFLWADSTADSKAVRSVDEMVGRRVVSKGVSRAEQSVACWAAERAWRLVATKAGPWVVVLAVGWAFLWAALSAWPRAD